MAAAADAGFEHLPARAAVERFEGEDVELGRHADGLVSYMRTASAALEA